MALNSAIVRSLEIFLRGFDDKELHQSFTAKSQEKAEKECGDIEIRFRSIQRIKSSRVSARSSEMI